MYKCAHCARMAKEKAALRNLIDDLAPELPPIYGLAPVRREMLGYMLRHQEAHYSGIMAAAALKTEETMKVHVCHIRKWCKLMGLTIRCATGSHYVVEPRSEARDIFRRLMNQDSDLLDEMRRRVLADPHTHVALFGRPPPQPVGVPL